MIEDVRTGMRNIETAAFELLEEGLAAHYRSSLARRLGPSVNLDKAIAGFSTERSLPEEFYGWTAHLFGLDRARELGAIPGPEAIQAVELRGLEALAQARARFRDRHPPCAHCGTLLFDRLVQTCEICGGDLKKKVA
ncbi:MAG: hypothetical protein LAN84_15500 [Acidobacteriia bacterium]|nr:hypothetical protein [Terriglobia bacterium]